jgi:hypothetical protein
MTVLATGDVRAFYEELGIELPGWSEREAPVRCFASPDSHNHGDRSPSTSVSLASGAWCCHGCGASGGAYDAAVAVGHTPRGAIELMIRHGWLIEPRSGPRSPRTAGRVTSAPTREPITAATTRRLAASDDDVRRWQSSLSHRPSLLNSLAIERGWRFGVLCQLEVGVDSAGRLTIPIRGRGGDLRGVLRYDPWHTQGPKMLAIRGTQLGLIPYPEGEPSPHVILVEGPADMLAARSCGMPAIAVPGTHAWRSEWAPLLAGRQVTVVMDCDAPGREAAARIATDLAGQGTATVIDLEPSRDDGYDLTDALLDRAHASVEQPSLMRLTRELSPRRERGERGLER